MLRIAIAGGELKGRKCPAGWILKSDTEGSEIDGFSYVARCVVIGSGVGKEEGVQAAEAWDILGGLGVARLTLVRWKILPRASSVLDSNFSPTMWCG